VSPVRASQLVLAAGLVQLLTPAASGEVYFDARVVRIADGDSIEVVREVGGRSERLEIRLAGIDAPERGQPWGGKARAALSQRVFGKPVRINAVATDRYGRTVAEVYADGVCVGCELLREGHAWVYRRYSHDPVLLELEAEARAAHRGLWSLPEAQQVPPWQWRVGAREAPAAAPPRLDAEDFRCGAKRSCGEMRSCAEARFQLERCGLEGLDSDRDGVPCEALCGGS
jgi:endonuclease YncB( thermonuclease family)